MDSFLKVAAAQAVKMALVREVFRGGELLVEAGRLKDDADELADAIALAGGGNYQDPGPLDPCHGCVALAARLGLRPDVFAPGTLLDPGTQ